MLKLIILSFNSTYFIEVIIILLDPVLLFLKLNKTQMLYVNIILNAYLQRHQTLHCKIHCLELFNNEFKIDQLIFACLMICNIDLLLHLLPDWLYLLIQDHEVIHLSIGVIFVFRIRCLTITAPSCLRLMNS